MTLGWALEHRVFMLLMTLATIVLTVRLYTVLPKGFLLLQDTGILIGSTQASPDISFQAMEERQRAAVDVILAGSGRRRGRLQCRRCSRLEFTQPRLPDGKSQAAVGSASHPRQ